MAKKIAQLFPSYVYRQSLASSKRLNLELETAIVELIEKDHNGRKRSASEYPNGYTSYPDNQLLHRRSLPFKRLTLKIMPMVRDFVRHLNWDINPKKIATIGCWANAMGAGAQHGLHNHQMSMISGVYYINAPVGSAPLVIEDPRVDHFMATPSRKVDAPERDRLHVSIKPRAGDLVLFESWMRHEVPLHQARQPRLSVAFNFGLPAR